MAPTLGIYYYNMKILKLFICISVYEFGFLHLFSTSFSILVSGLYMLYPNFYCSSHILLTMPDLGCYNCSYTDIGCPGLRLVLSTGPERTDVSHPLMCGWKQTQFPKRCSTERWLDKVQKPNNPNTYGLL